MTTAELNIFVRIRAAEAQRQLALVRRELAMVEAQTARSATASNRPWFQGLAASGSRLQWIGRQLTTLVTGPLALAAGASVKWGIENEQAMAKLKKVYGDAEHDASFYGKEIAALDRNFTQLSNKFGVHKNEVIEIGAAWSAAGSSGASLAKQTELTMRTMVIGEMDAVEATQALIAIQAQYGLSTDELTQTIYQLNAVENQTGTTLQGLVQGFSRAAGVARTVGVDTAHLSAMIAAITPAAGTASEAGNALKTVLSRLMGPTGETADIFQEMGIQLGNTSWESLNATERMELLAQKFEGLTGPQKAAASALIASRWQVNKFEVIMREMTSTTGYYAKALDVLSDKSAVARIAENELMTVLNTSGNKVKSASMIIKNSMTEAFLPLIPIFVTFMQWIAKAANAFQQLSPQVKVTALAIAALLAAMGPLVIILGVSKILLGQMAAGFAWLARAAMLPLLPFKALGKLWSWTTGRIVAGLAVARTAMVASAAATYAWAIGSGVAMQLLYAGIRGYMFLMRALPPFIYAVYQAITLYTMAWAAGTTAIQRGMYAAQLAAQRAWAVAAPVIASAAMSLQTTIMVAWWATQRQAAAAFYATQGAIQTAGHALSLAIQRTYHAASAGLASASYSLQLALSSGYAAASRAFWSVYWTSRLAIQAAGQTVSNALQAAWHAVQLGLSRAYIMATYAINTAFWTGLAAIQTAGQALLTLGQKVWAKVTFLLWTVLGNLLSISWSGVWTRIVAITAAGRAGVLAVIKSLGKGLIAALTSPVGLAIAAVVLLLVIFKDKIRAAVENIKAYFANLPSGVAKGLAPIGQMFMRIRNAIVNAFNSLPESVQKALMAVVNIVKAAAMAVYKLFSYFNPFAHHSPSLVENVTEGMAVVGDQFSQAANAAEGDVSRMYSAIQSLKGAADGFTLQNKNAKDAEQRQLIIDAGGADSLPQYDALNAQLEELRWNANEANMAMQDQQSVVDGVQDSIDAYDKQLKNMNKTLDALKKVQDAMSDAVDRAKESYDRYASAQIKGMKEAEDATFANTMEQKKLQLQIARMKESVGDIDSVTDAHAKLQGQIEMLMGTQADLRKNGAGSDILGPYDDMIAKLKAQQGELGSGAAAGPAAAVKELETRLSELQRQAEIMDLEKALKFDPLTKQLDDFKNKTEELPFETIMAGLSTSRAQVDMYTMAYDAATMAVDGQNAAIEAATAGREALQEKYDVENEKLDVLKARHESVTQAIQDGEAALQEYQTTASETYQRMEEAARKAEEEARKAEEKSGGGEEYVSPGLQNFRNAAAGDFEDVSGSVDGIAREGGIGDQAAEIDKLTADLAAGVADSLGGLNPFQFLIDGWNKVKAWFSTNIGPFVQPIKDALGGIGEAIKVGFGGEGNTPLSGFSQTIQQVVDTVRNGWNMFTDFAGALGRLFGPDLKSTIQEIVQGFVGLYERLQPKLKELWDTIGPAVRALLPVFGLIGGAIIGVIEIIWELINGALGPAFDIIGAVIGGIIDVVKGIIEVITGVVNTIVGLIQTVVGFFKGIFTGDWSMFTAGIQTLVDGVVGIFTGLVDIIWGIITSIGSIIKNGFELVWNTVYGFVKGVWDFFMWLWDELVGHSIIPDLINGIIQWFSELPGKVLAFVIDLVVNVISWFASLPDKIFEAVAWIREKLHDVFVMALGYLAEKLPGLIAGVMDFFRNLPDRIKDTLANASNALYEFGVNIVQGLLNGAGSLLSKIGQFFLDKLPGWIKEPFKKAMGIESPSKVFAEYGTNTGQGFIQGLEGQLSSVAAASQGLADAATGITLPELAAPTVAAATTPTPAANAPVADVAALDALPGDVATATAQAQVVWDTFSVSMTAKVTAFTNGVVVQFTTMNNGVVAATTDMVLKVGEQYGLMVTSTTTQFTTMQTTAVTLSTNMSTATVQIVTAMVAAIMAQINSLRDQLILTMTETTNTVGDLWSNMSQSLATTMTDGIVPVFEAFTPMLQALEDSFASTVDNVGTIWDGIREKTAAPARFVINDVYNDGIRGAWNQFNSFLDLPPLDAQVAKFATGGKVWGAGTGTSDSIPALLSNGEHVITAKEVRGAGGHAAIEQTRKLWASNNPALYAKGGAVQAFADGGSVSGGAYMTTPIQQSMWDAVRTAFPGVVLTSGTRTEQVLGRPDNHNMGRALDLGGPMQGIAQWIARTYPNSLELIHAPEAGFRNIWHGAPHTYDAGTMADHYDHVHWAVDNIISSDGKLISTAGGGAAIPMDQMVKDAINKKMDEVRDRAPEIAGGIGQWIPKSIEKGRAMLLDKLVPLAKQATQAMAAAGVPGNVESWRPMAMEAMRRNGFNADDPAQVNAMMRQIASESSGNPRAIQQVQDVNSGGNEAVGLLQIAKGTWPGVRDPSLPDDRMDPWANMNGALRYYRGKYGSDLTTHWGHGHGYDSGGLLMPGDNQLVYNRTGQPEPVLTGAQWDAMYTIAENTSNLNEETIKNAMVSATQEVYGFDPTEAQTDAIIQGLDDWNKSFTPIILDAATNQAAGTKAQTEAAQKTQTAVEHFTEVGGKIKTSIDQFSKLALAIASAMQAENQNFEAWAPVLSALGDFIASLPDVERDWAADNPVPGETDAQRKAREQANAGTNALKGLYMGFKDVAPVVLKHTAAIGTAVSQLVAQNAPIVSAALAMMPVNPVGAAIMLIPVILQSIFTLLPMIIQAIMEIVPALIKAIMRFFTQFMPDSVYAYEDMAAAEAAVKTQLEGGPVAMGQGQRYPVQQPVQSTQTNQTVSLNVYGDLVMPNVTNTDGAQTFADNLKLIASNKS